MKWSATASGRGGRDRGRRCGEEREGGGRGRVRRKERLVGDVGSVRGTGAAPKPLKIPNLVIS